MTNVLVTGGAGFIGSHLVDFLVNKDYEVTILDNLSTGNVSNLKQAFMKDRVTFVQGDVRDFVTVSKCVREKDAVIHLAALTSIPSSMENETETFDVNTKGTLNVLKACESSRVTKFIFASSCAVYGEPNSIPTNEDHPIRPSSPYASSKAMAERLCQEFASHRSLNTISFRLFNVYGPRQNHGAVIREFIDKVEQGEAPVVFGNGEQTRDFVFIDDVVRAISLGLQSNGLGMHYNLGSGQRICINELLRQIGIIHEEDSVDAAYQPPRKGDVRHSQADITRIREELSFEPSVNLDKGLHLMVQSLAKGDL